MVVIMIAYNYLEEMKKDIKEHLEENAFEYFGLSDEDVHEKLYDNLWVEDSVTGNGSGSYTFDREKAKKYVVDNIDLLVEACEELADDLGKAIKMGWEYCDVTIRCYLLSQAISEIIDNYDFNEMTKDYQIELIELDNPGGGKKLFDNGSVVYSEEDFKNYIEEIEDEDEKKDMLEMLENKETSLNGFEVVEYNDKYYYIVYSL